MPHFYPYEGSSPVARQHIPWKRRKKDVPAPRQRRKITRAEAAPEGPRESSGPVLLAAKRTCHDGDLPQGWVGVDRPRGMLVMANRPPE